MGQQQIQGVSPELRLLARRSSGFSRSYRSVDKRPSVPSSLYNAKPEQGLPWQGNRLRCSSSPGQSCAHATYPPSSALACQTLEPTLEPSRVQDGRTARQSTSHHWTSRLPLKKMCSGVFALGAERYFSRARHCEPRPVQVKVSVLESRSCFPEYDYHERACTLCACSLLPFLFPLGLGVSAAFAGRSWQPELAMALVITCWRVRRNGCRRLSVARACRTSACNRYRSAECRLHSYSFL